jgi:CHAD domain-containing protein
MPRFTKPGPLAEAYLALAPDARPEGLAQRLGGRFRVRRQPAVAGREVLFDTPDWRLDRAHMTLAQRGEEGRAELVLERAGEPPLRSPANGHAAFAWELPAGLLAESVGRVAHARRLLPQVELHVRRTPLAVLDERGKTVARVHLAERRAALPGGAEQRLATTVRVEPLRGYGEEHAQVVEFLRGDRQLVPAEADGLGAVLRALGRDPEAQRLPWQIELAPREPAGRALRAVLSRYHEILRANEPGLLADVDVEFTHDVRIAIRRTRSVLRQAKQVLARAPRRHFKEEFAWIGQSTSRVRDLDLLELAAHGRRGQLGGAEPSDLEPLQRHLAEQRREAFEGLVTDLRSPRYLDLMETWPLFLAAAAPDDLPGAAEPVVAFAARRIARQHRRVLERAAELGKAPPGAELHALRIECKELRYVADAFGRLFPVQPVARLVKQQKRLQDVLGELNDVRVQRELVERSAAALAGASPAALIAIGRAIESLAARADELRPQALERIAAFVAEDHRELLAGFAERAEG